MMIMRKDAKNQCKCSKERGNNIHIQRHTDFNQAIRSTVTCRLKAGRVEPEEMVTARQWDPEPSIT
jgi:hypothetical protein